MSAIERAAAERALHVAAASCFAQYRGDPSLVPFDPQTIRVGRAGGLPFDSLTGDVVSGCLPAASICYGSCFAARAAFEAGYDFGVRVRNRLDAGLIEADLDALPAGQGHLRNGWNSDPSWAWDLALDLARMVVAAGRHMVFITKAFRMPSPTQLDALGALGAEFRVSISAFDTAPQLGMRTGLIEAVRAAGGIAVPQLLTARFRSQEINRKQDEIVAWFAARDYPVSENSLRFAAGSPLLDLIDLDACGRVASTDDHWAGRLYPELRVPTLTSVPPGYRGLESGFLSRNDLRMLEALWRDPVHTNAEVLAGDTVDKPQQCGVSAVRGRACAAAEG
ncbi:MAG: hypothetical protein CMN73_03095 [Sphingomonas sp.]|nr:hypothetical protein [Sphingomonas sp.]